MNIVAVVNVILMIAYTVISETFLPNLQVRLPSLSYCMGKAALDVLHHAFKRECIRGENQMDVIGHHNKIM